MVYWFDAVKVMFQLKSIEKKGDVDVISALTQSHNKYSANSFEVIAQFGTLV